MADSLSKTDTLATVTDKSVLNGVAREAMEKSYRAPARVQPNSTEEIESSHSVVVVGAGPAGLTAAYDLVRHGVAPLVLEKLDRVGGIARTEEYNGYRFDIGGHRFYTKVEEVEQLWKEVLGAKFQTVPRLSRIFYNGKFFDYPLDIKNTLRSLGAIESTLILLSYLRWKIAPFRDEETFEHWVTNRFGARLFRTFFKTYTEKVWGISCDQIQAEWAAQRIRGLSLTSAVLNALLGTHKSKTLIKQFEYPELGPGQMWERFAEEVESAAGKVLLETETLSLRHSNNRITEIVSRDAGGKQTAHQAEHFISTMPITELVEKLDPAPPVEVLAACQGLSYRALMLVGLIVKGEDLFPDNWIYIHSPNVQVGRIQNFKNWSAAMVPDASNSSLGMEYFCSEGDDLWNMSDDELLKLAGREIVELGLARKGDVMDGVVIRQPKAYPVYDATYREHLQMLRDYLAQFTNLQTIGRNGMHRYNNQDHSMLTGLFAARNIQGEEHDLWEVNTERSYYEEFSRAGATTVTASA